MYVSVFVHMCAYMCEVCHIYISERYDKKKKKNFSIHLDLSLGKENLNGNYLSKSKLGL